MKRFYYVVSKQLDNVDGFEETNGWKDISVYKAEGDRVSNILSLEIPNSDNSKESIMSSLEEEGIVNENETVELIQL